MTTSLLPTATPEALATAVERAVELLRAGEVVALPTETVYGLAGDATSAAAIARIFEAKERPAFDPLIVHLPDEEWLPRVATIPPESQALVAALTEKFWPGPLTLVLPKRDLIPDLATSGLATVAVRRSAHPVFQAVLERFGKPLAAPSANRFGRISPTTGAHVLAELGDRIPAIVDAGATTHGIESTVVAVRGRALAILRAGPVTAEMLGAFGEIRMTIDEILNPEAPGQLASHYAPRTPLRIVPDAPASSRTGLLAWREPRTGFGRCEVLSPRGDLREAAANLFAAMRRLDDAGLDLILAEPVPETGLGVAIMDRLRKAAAHV